MDLTRLDNYTVWLAATSGRISGVDLFSANLVRELNARGYRAAILVTQPQERTPDPLPFPQNVPRVNLPVTLQMNWQRRWRVLREFLEQGAPCFYLPNYDWRYSGISPTLSARVKIIGIAHSDDAQHYEHVARLGAYWNHIVAVSCAIASEIKTRHPQFRARVSSIPYGVAVPTTPARKNRGDGELRLVYAGRLTQTQKRVFDLAHIANALYAQDIPFSLTVIGDGADRARLAELCAPLFASGHVKLRGSLPNEVVLREYARHDVFILTSEYEGLSLAMLEAMARGCVPVVTNVRSGVPEILRDGENGLVIPLGDTQTFVNRLMWLQRDRAQLEQMSRAAYQTLAEGEYRIEAMTARYVELFEKTIAENFVRPRGNITPLDAQRIETSWIGHLPFRVRHLVRRLRGRKFFFQGEA